MTKSTLWILQTFNNVIGNFLSIKCKKVSIKCEEGSMKCKEVGLINWVQI